MQLTYFECRKWGDIRKPEVLPVKSVQLVQLCLPRMTLYNCMYLAMDLNETSILYEQVMGKFPGFITCIISTSFPAYLQWCSNVVLAWYKSFRSKATQMECVCVSHAVIHSYCPKYWMFWPIVDECIHVSNTFVCEPPLMRLYVDTHNNTTNDIENNIYMHVCAHTYKRLNGACVWNGVSMCMCIYACPVLNMHIRSFCCWRYRFYCRHWNHLHWIPEVVTLATMSSLTFPVQLMMYHGFFERRPQRSRVVAWKLSAVPCIKIPARVCDYIYLYTSEWFIVILLNICYPMYLINFMCKWTILWHCCFYFPCTLKHV